MGYIKEPAGIDFFVDHTPITKDERKKISEIIAHYKLTGHKVSVKPANKKSHLKNSKKKTIA